MVAAVHKDIAATGATILTDSRKSITSDQIVNFLASGPTGAYLFRTVQRDGAVQETAEVVVVRWKDVFDKFGVENINAICTDSASAYVAASKLLVKEEVKYSRITWLSCAVHVCNLLLSDIAKDGTPGKLGKREDTIIRARAVVRFIREHGATLNLYQRFSAAHPSYASAVAASSSAAPPLSQRRGRELVYPAQTRFATHYLMLERLLDRRRALESLMISDDWLQTAWRRSIFLQPRWLLRHLDRGGRVMTRMWSWVLAMVDRVVRARLNKTSTEELNIVVQVCQARVDHMLEPAHCMAHLLNPRHKSITYFGAARRSEHDKTLAEESLRYLRQQTSRDEELYQTLRTQLAEFLTREGNWTYEGVEGDRDAASCRWEKETSQVGQWGSGYVLPWEDAEEETEDSIPPPRDEGVRPADRVTEAQRERQVQRRRKDRLSKAPPSVETYFGRRATVLMPTELDAVNDPEPDPMAQDPIEAEPWSDPDDLAVESEPGGSDDGGDNVPLVEMLHPRTRASTAAAAQHLLPPPPPPSSARASTAAAAQHPPPPPPPPSSGRASTGAIAQHPPPPTDRPGHGEQGTRDTVEEGRDDYDDVREGTRATGKTRMIPPIPRHADVVTTTTTMRAAMVHMLQVVCGGRVDSVPTDAVVQAREAMMQAGAWGVHETRGLQAVVAEDGRGESLLRPLALCTGSMRVPRQQRLASGRQSERGNGDADAAAPPVSHILRDIPSCSMGDISSSMLQEAAAGIQGSSGQEECAAGDGRDCRPVQERAPESEQYRIDCEERERAQDLASRCEMTQSIVLRARAERMLETGGGEGHRAMDDAVLECGDAGGGDAGERPASLVQGVCILPISEAMTTGELERQAREDRLHADRCGRMDEASRRFMAEGPAYVSCNPSLPSSTTGGTTSVHAEGATASPTPAESPSPKSRKKKMKAGKSLSTVRRVTHAMRESQPRLAGLHPRTREALARDVVVDTVGWRERASTRATEQPMTTPAAAAMPRTEGRIPGGTGGGDGVTDVATQRRRKDIVDDDDT
ncbi:hypothetical protein CBR_g50103 [Chara braunii]|uniref:DUF659 domain-containing protein n=1 Tax=Chara braunii TaxID=69332 RepID=A0A388M645_CHABU|nr:hypothetical protein CBR_g50103 [Chara braunii]|eukprot:GBG90010.1 hypothetical protein CBR_g50103 [Chara braunii]